MEIASILTSSLSFIWSITDYDCKFFLPPNSNFLMIISNILYNI